MEVFMSNKTTTFGNTQISYYKANHDFTSSTSYTFSTGLLKSLTIQIYGTWVASVALSGSIDGTNFQTLDSAKTINGNWTMENENWAYYKVTVTYTSGTVSVICEGR